MVNRFLFLLPILFAPSCGQFQKEKADKDSLNLSELTSQKNKWLEARSIQSRIDSLALLEREKKETVKTDSVLPPVEENMELMIKQATSDHFVVIAGESFDYTFLKKTAQDLNRKSRIPYVDEGLIYNPAKGLIWPPDTSANADIYSGSYHLRRYGTMNGDTNFLSLEMRDWYFDLPADKQTLKMILVAGLYSDSEKKEAEERLKQIRKYCPTAYIRKTPIYMGCIH